MMDKDNVRRLQCLLLFITIGILSAAYYIQYVQHIVPCPLCMVQRVFAFLFAFTCILGCIPSSNKGRIGIMVAQAFFSCAGFIFALRQLWLQHTAQESAACLPDFDILLHYFPWKDIIHALFWGAGDCAIVSWTLFGLSIAGWSAVYFLGMFLLSVLSIVYFIFFHFKKTSDL